MKRGYYRLFLIFFVELLLIAAILATEQKSQIVTAEEILCKLENGEPIIYKNIIIVGDLNASKANLPISDKGINVRQNIIGIGDNTMIVESLIDIENSNFLGIVDFDRCIFKKPINFCGSNFSEDVFLRYVQFDGEADFSYSNFGKNAFFEWTKFKNDSLFREDNFKMNSHFLETQFNGIADFNGVRFDLFPDFRMAEFREAALFKGAIFSQNAFFEKARFLGDLDLKGGLFSGYTTFIQSEFYGLADLRGVKFLRNALFTRSKFNREAFFSAAQFENLADFGYVTFNEPAQFWNVQFLGKADFSFSKFVKEADFSGSKFSGDANYRSARFSENSIFNDISFCKYFDFNNANLKNSYIEGNVYINNLNLTRTKYDRIYLRWASIGNLDFDLGAYLYLIKNYDNLGWNGDNKNCYYSYRIAAQNEELANYEILPWSIDFLHWISYGYGIKPQRPLMWSVISIVIFGFIFWHKNCISKLVREEIIEQKGEDVVINTILKRTKISLEDPIFFSLTTFTSGLTSFIHPNIEYRLDGKYMRLAIIERFLGSILIALFFTAIGRIYLTR